MWVIIFNQCFTGGNTTQTTKQNLIFNRGGVNLHSSCSMFRGPRVRNKHCVVSHKAGECVGGCHIPAISLLNGAAWHKYRLFSYPLCCSRAWLQAFYYPLPFSIHTSEGECRVRILAGWEGKSTRVHLGGNQSYPD